MVNTHPLRPMRWLSERCVLGYILGISFALQLLVSPFQGVYLDLQTYLVWGRIFDSHPLLFYSLAQSNYPPLTIYIFGAVDVLYFGIGHLVGFSNAQLAASLSSPFSVLWSVAKLPIIAANLGASWLIYRLARQAASARVALLAALAYAVAPSMLLDGAVWGQTDGVSVFFVLLSLVALQARRPVQVGVFLALAVMIKPQPVIFLPLVLWYVMLTAGWRHFARVGLAGLATILLICTPFLLPPDIQMLVFLQNTVNVFNSVGNDALNLWFLLSGFMQNGSWTYQTPVIGSLTITTVGLLLFAPVYALALWLVWRQRGIATLYMALALVAIGFFDLTALQRERYLFQALAFLLLAAVSYRSFVLHYIVASVTVFTNMLEILALSGVFVTKLSEFVPLYWFFIQNPQVRIMAALLNLALLLAVSVSCFAWMRDAGRRSHVPLSELETAGIRYQGHRIPL